jgi:hypothetical protein
MEDKDFQDGPSDEELEELIEQLKELEKENGKRKKRRRPGIFTIEFGGVYHPNRIINFLFSMIINITFSYTIISVFRFANYKSIEYFLLFIVVYSCIEWGLRDYIIRNYIQFVIKTFGFVFYFSYLLLLFVLDQMVFIGNFTFVHATNIVAFLTIFVIVRYIIGTAIRRYFRRQLLR